MFHHLDNEHKISVTTKSAAQSSKSIQSYFGTDRKVAESQKKHLLVRDLVLLCCKDLLPFDLVEGNGLQDFFEVRVDAYCNFCTLFMSYALFAHYVLQKYKVISKDDLPHRTTISRALSSVYDDCKAWMICHLKNNCPDTVSVTFDLWSCKYRRRSYITLTLHYINKVFELVDITLSTSHFPDSHKGVHILPKVESILDSFGLSDKDISFVTDAGIIEILLCSTASVSI